MAERTIFEGRVVTIHSNKLNIEEQVLGADLVIGTVLVPGASAPKLVTEDMVRSTVPCGPDAQRHLGSLREYAGAGYDEVYVQQIGPDQDAFFEGWAEHVPPAPREQLAPASLPPKRRWGGRVFSTPVARPPADLPIGAQVRGRRPGRLVWFARRRQITRRCDCAGWMRTATG